MTARLVILGGDGIGSVVAETIAALRSSGDDVTALGFLNDVADAGVSIGGLPVLGRFDDWRLVDEDACFIAAFPKAEEAHPRYRRLLALGIPAGRWASIRHPSAQIAADTVIERGCYLGAHAVVEPGARIGAHTMLRAGAYVSHGVHLGAFGFVGPNATLLGLARLGDGVHVGANSVVCERIAVGAYAVAGIGSVLVRDVEPFTVVAGNPARTLRHVRRET